MGMKIKKIMRLKSPNGFCGNSFYELSRRFASLSLGNVVISVNNV